MAVAGSPKVQMKQKKNKAGKAELVATAAVVSLPITDGATAASGNVTDQNISSPRKRTKDPGVRIVGGRIYDSQNGRTCHQCRQKTMDLTASCKNARKSKPCPIRFCFKCLLNRYGEIAGEINGMDSWNCPKCRGICNCSLCMKKKGENPTGILVHTAKATGFSSVSDMLRSGIDLNKCKELKSPKARSCSSTKMASDGSSQTTVKSKEGVLRKRKRDVDCTDVSHGDTKPSSVGKEVKKKPSKLLIDSSKELDTQDTKNENRLRTYCYGPSEEVKSIGKNATKEVVGPTRSGSDHPSEEETPPKAGPKKLSKQQRLKPAEKPSSKELVEEENTCMVKVKSKKEQSKPASKPSVTKLVEEESVGKSKQQPSKPAEKRSSVELVKEENTRMGKVKSKKKRSNPAELPSSVEAVNEENIGTMKVKSAKSKKFQFVLNMHSQNGKEKPPVSVKSEILQKIVKVPIQEEDAVVVLPQGEEVKEVAGIEFSADDVGPALQFLEFCAAFGKVLDLKRGQPESILRELTRGRRIERRGLYSSAALFHVKLLDLLEESSPVLHSPTSGNLWLQQLHKCISKSPFALKELPPAYLNRGPDEYSKLDPSKKLRLLNFLCEEALETEHLRNWIDEENLKFLEKKKEHNENLLEVNKKEKDMKQKMKDEMARILLSTRDGAPISHAESQDVISRIKKEADEAHAEKLKALELKSKFKKQRSDAVRTEHVVFDKSGRIYWRLSGGSSGSRILLQDVGNWDSTLCQDRWFIYDDKQEKSLEKYIFSLRKRYKSRRSSQVVNLLDKENLQYQSPSNTSSPSSAVEEAAV